MPRQFGKQNQNPQLHTATLFGAAWILLETSIMSRVGQGGSGRWVGAVWADWSFFKKPVFSLFQTILNIFQKRVKVGQGGSKRVQVGQDGDFVG